MSLPSITMNFLAAQGVAGLPTSSNSASTGVNSTAVSALDSASLSSLATAGTDGLANLGSLSDYLSGQASGSSGSSASLGLSGSADFASMVGEIAKQYKGNSSSSANNQVMSTAANMLKTYFKQFCPGMSDDQITAICNMASAQYGDLAKAMDMSSLTSSVMGSSSAASGATGASSSAGSSAVSKVSAKDVKGTAWGKALAADAESHATGSGGWCFKYVRQALERHGVTGVGGASAYMAADQLARNSNFKEISVSESDLRNLPAGYVVVWNRGNGASRQHGHICISLGDGREASDVIRKMTQGYGTSFRVFQPVK